MLHRFITFALGQFQIGNRHIILEIDEMLVAFIIFARGGSKPDGFKGSPRWLLDLRRLELRCLCLGIDQLRRHFACRMGLGQSGGNRHGAIGATYGLHGVLVAVRPEALQGVIKFDLARIMAPEMKRRIKAAGHGDEITGNFAFGNDPALAFAVSRNARRCDAQSTLNPGNHRAHGHFDAFRLGAFNQGSVSPGAGIHHPHGDASLLQAKGREIGVVIIGEHDAAHAGGNAIALNHGAGG